MPDAGPCFIALQLSGTYSNIWKKKIIYKLYVCIYIHYKHIDDLLEGS